MGHTASIPTPVFSLAKEEYEAKKNELSDADLFNHMKAFIEAKTLEQAETTEVAAAPAVDIADAPTEIVAAEVDAEVKEDGVATAPAAEVEIPAGETVQTEVTAAL